MPEHKEKNIKVFDPEETKKKVLKFISILGDKEMLLKELGEDIIPNYTKSVTGKEKDQMFEKFQKKSSDLLRILELESHMCLMETFTPSYQMLSNEMSDQMIKEYNCDTGLERSLVEVIVNSFIRIIDNSRRLNNEFECGEITKNRNVFIANLSKQLDRANRQYFSALMTLRLLKSPQIEVNVKSTNTYMSQNQQINIDKDEIITN